MKEIILDFILFSIIGYIGEIIYCSFKGRKSGKALRGPWCPLYGLGGTLILHITKLFPKNIIIIYISGVIIASTVEYTMSIILEKIFETKWWDYKEKKYNLNGRICLENSLLFGVLSLILFYIYIPLKTYLLNFITTSSLNIIITIISITMLIDAIVTILEVIELKRRLNLIESMKKLNTNIVKTKLTKLKTNLNPNRLLKELITEKEDINLKKTYENIKTHFKLKK